MMPGLRGETVRPGSGLGVRYNSSYFVSIRLLQRITTSNFDGCNGIRYVNSDQRGGNDDLHAVFETLYAIDSSMGRVLAR